MVEAGPDQVQELFFWTQKQSIPLSKIGGRTVRRELGKGEEENNTRKLVHTCGGYRERKQLERTVLELAFRSFFA